MKPVTYKAVAAEIMKNLYGRFTESEVRWIIQGLSRMHRADKTQDPAHQIVGAMSRLHAKSSQHPFEQYWSNFETKWPVRFTVEVTSKHQAETLACCLIRVERYLRRQIPLGDYKNPNRSLADRLALARRKLQEDAGLVASDAEVAEIVRRNRQLKSPDEAAANFKKGIASPPITLKPFLHRKKGRKKS